MLISTGTRTLQDQLFNKDLPLVAGAIGVPARVALLKGRANYLCSYRLRAARGQRSLAAPRDRHAGARRALGARARESGDLAEVPDLGDAHPLLAADHLDARIASVPVAPTSAGATWSKRVAKAQ